MFIYQRVMIGNHLDSKIGIPFLELLHDMYIYSPLPFFLWL